MFRGRHKKTTVTRVTQGAPIKVRVAQAVPAGSTLRVAVGQQIVTVRVAQYVPAGGFVAINMPLPPPVQAPLPPPVQVPLPPPVQAAPTSFIVAVPGTHQPGTPLTVQAPDGRMITVEVPADCKPGGHLTIAIPTTPVMPVTEAQVVDGDTAGVPVAEVVLDEEESACKYNGVGIPETLRQKLRDNGNPAHDGDWWYDDVSGAYGHVGGPCLKFMTPGLSGFGRIDPNCSHGSSGVFVNGRELHDIDISNWQTYVDDVPKPGRYSLDGNGDLKDEASDAFIHSAKALLYFKSLSSSSFTD